MAAPSMTLGAAGNALASQALAAGAPVTFNVDISTAFEGHLQVGNTGGGTVATTNGVQVTPVPRVGSTPVSDTVAALPGATIATVVSTTNLLTIKFQTGRYAVTLKNLDVTNAVTVQATLDLVASIA